MSRVHAKTMASLVDYADGDASAPALRQEVSLIYRVNNAFDIEMVCLQVSCSCKNTCQRSGMCPCKAACQKSVYWKLQVWY